LVRPHERPPPRDAVRAAAPASQKIQLKSQRKSRASQEEDIRQEDPDTVGRNASQEVVGSEKEDGEVCSGENDRPP
jgi:hypothetical protein